MKLGYHPIGQNYGFYIDKAPQNVLEELKVQIDELQSNFNIGEKANHTLAGEIQHEYQLIPPYETKQYIKDLSQRFENKSQHMVSNYNPIPTLKFDNLWVNFQKKYEYNPIHNHSGVYSFVIWYQIPYTFENEKTYSYKPNNKSCAHGKFQFVIPNTFSIFSNVVTYDLNIDNSKEGYVAIFSSNLDHVVYPFFSSDDYRITVAGNIIEI